jgi:rfaE bifunctional protein kinase chain/domain
MNDQNLSDVGILMDKTRLTTQKTRVISGNQHLLRVDEEEEHFISKALESKMYEFIKNITEDKNITSIIFQDYDKGVITPSLIKKVVTMANKQGVPVLVDPKKRNFLEYKNVTLFKPNFKELNEGLRAEIDKDDSERLASVMEELRKSKGHKYIMVTLSEKGIIINNGKDYHHIAVEPREIADVSGAGDTVISLAALCLGEGLSAPEIAFLSNLAGGQVCERAGVVPVDREQLLEEAQKKCC